MRRPKEKHYKEGDRPSASQYNQLVGLVRGLLGGSMPNSFQDSTGIHTRRVAPAEHRTRSAKIQAGGVPASNNGSFTCKLLDFAGDEIGDTIDVYAREHLGSNNFDSGDVHPDYSDGDIMSVFLDVIGVWYTEYPFEDTINCVCTSP